MTLNNALSRPTALLVVDMQNDFCHANGAFARRGIRLAPAVDGVVSNLRALVAAAHDTGTPVIFACMENGPWTDSPAWLDRVKVGPSAQELPTCAAGSWGVGFYGIAPAPQDRVIIKHRYSAFVDTSLEVCLRALEIRTLIVTGVVTNVCVESTARDAFMRDYWTITVSDCCAGNTQAEHDAALHNLHRYFGGTATSAEIMQEWSELHKATSIVRAG